jgi:hypothetical protein
VKVLLDVLTALVPYLKEVLLNTRTRSTRSNYGPGARDFDWVLCMFSRLESNADRPDGRPKRYAPPGGLSNLREQPSLPYSSTATTRFSIM